MHFEPNNNALPLCPDCDKYLKEAVKIPWNTIYGEEPQRYQLLFCKKHGSWYFWRDAGYSMLAPIYDN